MYEWWKKFKTLKNWCYVMCLEVLFLFWAFSHAWIMYLFSLDKRNNYFCLLRNLEGLKRKRNSVIVLKRQRHILVSFYCFWKPVVLSVEVCDQYNLSFPLKVMNRKGPNIPPPEVPCWNPFFQKMHSCSLYLQRPPSACVLPNKKWTIWSGLITEDFNNVGKIPCPKDVFV